MMPRQSVSVSVWIPDATRTRSSATTGKGVAEQAGSLGVGDYRIHRPGSPSAHNAKDGSRFICDISQTRGQAQSWNDQFGYREQVVECSGPFAEGQTALAERRRLETPKAFSRRNIGGKRAGPAFYGSASSGWDQTLSTRRRLRSIRSESMDGSIGFLL